MGFLLGVFLITGTTGSFLLWENYAGRADAKAAVVAAQSR
jgi:hypothetical protein